MTVHVNAEQAQEVLETKLSNHAEYTWSVFHVDT